MEPLLPRERERDSEQNARLQKEKERERKREREREREREKRREQDEETEYVLLALRQGGCCRDVRFLATGRSCLLTPYHHKDRGRWMFIFVIVPLSVPK